MKISTRGRYALRFMIDLCKYNNGNFIPLKDIATRQEISIKYLESIAKELSASKLIEAQHGKGGGYKLAKDPEFYTVLDILDVAEGSLAPVSCLEKGVAVCPRVDNCRTIGVWRGLEEVIRNYLHNIKLNDLIEDKQQNNWVI